MCLRIGERGCVWLTKLRKIVSRYARRRISTEKFTAMAVEAVRRARIENLKAGVPVFYKDWSRHIDIMELPDGRKFEIRFVPGAPRESNYEVIRELGEAAA